MMVNLVILVTEKMVEMVEMERMEKMAKMVEMVNMETEVMEETVEMPNSSPMGFLEHFS